MYLLYNNMLSVSTTPQNLACGLVLPPTCNTIIHWPHHHFDATQNVTKKGPLEVEMSRYGNHETLLSQLKLRGQENEQYRIAQYSFVVSVYDLRKVGTFSCAPISISIRSVVPVIPFSVIQP